MLLLSPLIFVRAAYIGLGVLGGGPAARAGLKPGNIITRINGETLHNPQQAIEMISSFKPGEKITMDILRGWNDLTVTATVTQRPHYPGA